MDPRLDIRTPSIAAGCEGAFRRREVVAAALLCLLPPTAGAAAPVVTGTLTLNGKPMRPAHAVAWLHDNAEGYHDRPLRIVFSEQAVPANALRGRLAQPVLRMAEKGEVRGLIVSLDPAQPGSAMLRALERGETGSSFSYNRSDGVIPGLKIDRDVVSGSIVGEASRYAFSLRFAAPLAREPAPTATLDGAALQASAQFAAATLWVEALGRGDLVAAAAASSGEAKLKLEADIESLGKKGAAEHWRFRSESLRRTTSGARRLIVRGDEATLIAGEINALRLARQGAGWSVAADGD